MFWRLGRQNFHKRSLRTRGVIFWSDCLMRKPQARLAGRGGNCASFSPTGRTPMAVKTRLESDSMGDIGVPADAYWGAQTQRSTENFKIGGQTFTPRFVQAYAVLKRAAATV